MAWKNSLLFRIIFKSIFIRLLINIPALTYSLKNIRIKKIKFNIKLFDKESSEINIRDKLLISILISLLIKVLGPAVYYI